ncbi:MAG: putative Ig domain-containing protein [Vicinamibacterales bacterium]
MAIAMTLLVPAIAGAANIVVPAGGNLQAALNAAQPGDTILLEPGATYVGNFVLPVHGGSTYVTLRTRGNDAPLPGPGTRISPAHAPYLAKLRSPNSVAALRSAASAAYWRVMLLEFFANQNGRGDIIALGSGSTAQSSLDLVPRHLIVDRVYVHGDPLVGQKRGILINSGDTTIVNSHVDEIKAIGQDTQAIAGANGPGPFHIENNHLEAAGEVFIVGGDDPKIPGLVPADLLFRGNTLTRPVRWRDPIVPAPTGVSAGAGGSGTLAAGTYAYRVVARRPAGTTTATSPRSVEVAATVGAGGSVTIRWDAVPHATEYRVYGRVPGGQTAYWRVTTTSFTDIGAAGTAGTPPANGTRWQVKNLFELKNLRRAQIDYNLMENNWLQAQSGIAVLLSVRNQYGGCPQCIVEDVTFEYNVVRNIGGGFSILGEDYTHPSQQTNNIRIRHNEFSGLDRLVWGGNGYFVNISEGPRDITVDHNTIISPNGRGVVSVTGPPVEGFVFTNNVARHNSYGIFGASMSYGNRAINYYFPNAVIRRNVLAGGRASLYPADNVFPTTADFEAHFVDYAGGDYALRPGTDWAGAGTDAQDLGADMARIRTARPGSDAEPPQVTTLSLPVATELEPYGAVLASGGLTPYRWSILDGTLPAGISLDPLTGALSGAASMAGDFVFTVLATDSRDATAAQRLMLRVERAIPPVAILTTAVAGAVATFPYTQPLEATGGLGTYVWSLTGGQLPSGILLSAAGVLSGTPATAGTWSFTVTAQDALDPGRWADRTFTLAVASSPNRAPAVSVRVSATSVVPVGASVTVTADASDVDGVVRSVTFFVNGQAAGSDTSAPFALTWMAQNGGPHTVTAMAIDDDDAKVTSAPVTFETTPEVVLYASDVQRMVGDFQLVDDPSAADGRRLWNPNRNVTRLTMASAAPVSYAELTFYAEAGRAYHIWMRGLAQGNKYTNDSFYAQFSGTVDAGGAAVHRIGTTSAMSLILEDGGGAHVAGWGWQDNKYGAFGAPLYFRTTGLQTIRLQQREDGLSIDQLVISPVRYLTTSPGLLKHDTTIVAKP